MNLKWSELYGSKSYWYEVQSVIDGKTYSLTSFIPIDPINGVGQNYQWRVRACIDDVNNKVDDPKICGEWSAWRYFKTIEPPVESKAGLIPCGRAVDDPNTPYNERESCQLKHFFLLFKIILDFLLWRLLPILLVLELLITGVIFYFSMNMRDLNTIASVKSIWKWTGIGLGVIFLAWIIINVFLSLLGYQISIFGKWWQIHF